MSNYDAQEDLGEFSPTFKSIDVRELIEQLAVPFAELDLPPGFDQRLAGRTAIVGILLAGIKGSPDVEGEVAKLADVAFQIRTEQRLGISGQRIMGAEDYPDPAVTFDFGNRAEFSERLTQTDDSSRLLLARNGRSWQIEWRYEPYEHQGIEAVGIRMSTNTLTGKSEAALSLYVHPEAPMKDNDGSLIDSLLQIREVGKRVFEYTVPNVKSTGYKTRTGNGKGFAFVTPEGARVVVELNGHHLKMTHCVELEDMPTAEKLAELDDEGRKTKNQETQDRLKILVSGQLNFIAREFPAFLDHVALIWGQKLPEGIISPRIGAHTDDLGLFDSNGNKKIDVSEVPPIVTDERQRELYLLTAIPNPQTTFDMIGGLDRELKQMRQAIAKAMSPERYEQVGLDPRATVLLIGPPGTGKTMIAEAVAREVDGCFLAVKGSDIMSMWAGEAEKNVAAMFDLVEVLGKDRKVVLFFDEIEAVAPSRNGSHMMEYERKITAEFLSALNRKFPNAIIIGATNTPANCDPAVTRPGRFTDIISIDNPTKAGRVQIINNWLDYYRQRAKIEVFNGVEVEALANASEGLNGSDIRTIVEAALVAEVEAALEENRSFRTIGTTALLNHISVHGLSTKQRFANHLTPPRSSTTVHTPGQPQVLLIP